MPKMRDYSNIKLSACCMHCLVKRQLERIESVESEAVKAEYIKKVMIIIAEAEPDETAPVVIAKINRLHQQYFKEAYSFEALKLEYNNMMMREEERIREDINRAEDPLLRALQYARVGNYIDFGALGSVSEEKLQELLKRVEEEEINREEYAQFLEDLSTAKELVYLADNCGEIVLDKLLIKLMRKQYKELKITVIVRGKPVLNDATLEDAKTVGLTEIVEVIGNGTEIAGTYLKEITQEAKDKLEGADLIISKGQGNFETLNGCGLNIYYLFLCKCTWFVSRFQLRQFEGVFINDNKLV